MTRPANVNFAKAVNFAMRNGLWHCEISHCEIFALRILYCEIFALRNWNWQCKFKIGIAKWHLALQNFALRNFRIAKFSHCEFDIWHCEMHSVLRLLFHCSCILLLLILSSTASHFLHFALVFPLIYGLFDG